MKINTYLKLLVGFLCFMMCSTMIGQSSDLFRIEYLHVPNSKLGSSINRFRSLFQLPLKLKERNYLVVGGEFRYTRTELDDFEFDAQDINSLYRIEGNLGYLYQTEGDWIYAVKVGLRIASNLQGKAISDDLVYVTNAYAIRDRTKEGKSDKPNRLIVGMEYTTTAGRNFPLPILNYYREFHPDWTYTIGVPKTNLRYKFDAKNHVQAFVTIDNIFANIQNNIVIDGQIAENVSSTIVLGGIGYEHYFTDHILYYGYLGHTFINDYRFRDGNREELFVVEDRNTLYFRTGFKLKI